MTPGLLINTRHWANLLVVKMIWLVDFGHLENSFSHKEVQVKYFFRPIKIGRLPAENFNEILIDAHLLP